MLRNIQAMQHNLTTLDTRFDSCLDCCVEYYQLWSSLPEALVRKLECEEAPPFTFAQYKAILDLQSRQVLAAAQHPLRKQYDDLLLRLKRKFQA